ncbi:MAG: hypothetical protein ACXQS5_03380 [Candidatus Methanospirareceae archaeon]
MTAIPVNFSELFPIGAFSIALALLTIGIEVCLWPRESVSEIVEFNSRVLSGIPSFISSIIIFVSTLLFELPSGFQYFAYFLWGYSTALAISGVILQLLARRRRQTMIEDLF